MWKLVSVIDINQVQVCALDDGRRRRSRDTVRSDTAMPNLPNSPWMRGAPQRGFVSVIWSTSVRMAAVVLGRPGRVSS